MNARNDARIARAPGYSGERGRVRNEPATAEAGALRISGVRPAVVKILHVFGQMNRGGAELRTLDILRHLDRQRFRLDFVALSGLPGTLDGQIRELGSAVHYCPLGVTFPVRFRRLLRSGRYDGLHSHVHYFSGYLLRLAAQVKVPVRIAHFRSTHDDHGSGVRRTLQRTLLRHWIDRYATHIVAVGTGAMRASWGAGWSRDGRCQVVPNGLDVTAFQSAIDREGVRRQLNLPPACTCYLHVGRMIEDKNHLRVVSIFAQVFRRNPSARLVLVGKGGGPIEDAVHRSVEALGIAGAVTFAGERDDVPRLLQAADLMLFPSRREGLPGVVLEACAAGLPVLASDLPGTSEIASHFPAVRCLSLDAPDECWSRAAEQLLSLDRSLVPGRRNSALDAFASSPFSLDRCLGSLCGIWDMTTSSTRRRNV